MKWMNRKPLSQWNFVSERSEHECGWTNLNLIMIRQKLWSLEVDNNLKRLVSQNCLLVTSALLLLYSSAARNLGVLFDRNLKFDAQITKRCCTCYYHLHKKRKIRKYLTLDSTRCLIHALVIGHVDYCNSLLYRLPRYNINKLQPLQNMAIFMSRPNTATKLPKITKWWFQFQITSCIMAVRANNVEVEVVKYVSEGIFVSFSHVYLKQEEESECYRFELNRIRLSCGQTLSELESCFGIPRQNGEQYHQEYLARAL